MKRSTLELLAVITLAASFRLPLLGSVPPGFYCDEASTGYDAWSILQTGCDQYGERLPLFARSFGDWNEATYRYLVVPAVAVLGRTELAVRLPAALVGILSCVVLLLLARELLSRRDAFLAALLLAASPWHVQFSRVGDRAILLPAFFTLGLLLLLQGRRHPRLFAAAGVAFVLSLHTYSPARAFVPVLLVIVAVIFWRDLVRGGRWAALGGALVALAVALLLPFWLSEQGMARARYDFKFGPSAIAANYASYFDPRFLFLKGDPILRQDPRGVALLHLFEIVTVPVGIALLLRGRDRRAALLGAWLVLVPFPAAITAPHHATRAIAGVPLLAMLSGMGLGGILDAARGRAQRIWGWILAVVAGASVLYYAHVYFVRYPKDSWVDWQYGMREAFHFAESGHHDRVFVSDLLFLPHIFVLFYAGIPPEEYQAAPLQGLRQGQWSYTNVAIGRYVITAVERMPTHGDYLLFLPPRQSEFAVTQLGCRVAHVVLAPDGTVAYRLVETPR